MEKNLNFVRPKIGRDVQASIEMLNEAAIDAIINCAASGDPLAHLLLGCEKDVLTEMRTVAKHQFMGASRLGSISLVKLRFPGAATWRMLREGGFAKEDVLRELQREPGFNGIY